MTHTSPNTNIYKDFAKATKIANQHLHVINKNAELSSVDPAYIRTDVCIKESEFGPKAELSAAIDETLTGEYIKSTSSEAEMRILAHYSSKFVDLIGSPESASSLKNLSKAAGISLEGLSEPSGLRRAVIAMENLARKYNGIHKGLQRARAEVDNEIVKEIARINQLLSAIHSDNEIMRDFADKKSDAMYVEAEKRMWKHTTQLAEGLGIGIRRGEHGMLVNIVTQDEIYSLVGQAHASRLFYKGQDLKECQGEEVFNPISLRRLGKTSKAPRAVDDLEIVTSGKDVGDIIYRVQGGKLGGLLRIRDRVIPEALKQYDKEAVDIMASFNEAHNEFSSHQGSSFLSGSKMFTLDTVLSSRGKARISVVDKNGMPIPQSGKPGAPGFVGMELDMEELSFNGEAPNVQSIVTAMSEYFSLENRRVELSGLHDAKLITINKDTAPGTLGSEVRLGLQVSNKMQSSALGLKVLNLQARDANGVVLPVVGGALDDLIPAGTRQKMVKNFDIAVDNSGTGPGSVPLAYPYTVEFDVEVQSNKDSGPVKSTLVYSITDPKNKAQGVNGIQGQSISIAQVKSGKAQIYGNGDGFVLKTDFKNAAGVSVALSGEQGVLSLSCGDHRIVVSQLDQDFSGKSSNAGDMVDVGFSELFGLNDLFKNRDPKKWHQEKNAARDMEVRSDIARDPQLFAHARPMLAKLDTDAEDEIYPDAVFRADFGFQDYNELMREVLDAAVIRIVEYFEGHKRANSRDLKSVQGIKEGLEEALNNFQGVGDHECEHMLLAITQMQSATATAFKASKELYEIFLHACR